MFIDELFSYKLLLHAGICEPYEKWISKRLETENPLSDLTLQLSTLGNNNDVISELSTFTLGVKINYTTVFNIIWETLHKNYSNGTLSRESCVCAMYIIATNTDDYLSEPWYSMYILHDLLDEAKSRYITMESFNDAFEAFINQKIPVSDTAYSHRKEVSQKWWKRIFKHK
ncbi:MAG: hypothetical protein RR444_07160 [Oscillospiraceae bacterium]